jgi:siroheme decarboxylase
MNVTQSEKELIRALQQDLPLAQHPFAEVAEQAGLTEQAALDKILEWKRTGVIRRFGALLAHRRAGFTANGMVVWDVTDEQLEPAGNQFSAHPSVSHCYARPAFPGWPYRLYTMVHGRSRDEVNSVAEELSRQSGISGYDILYSTREFKKSDTKLFCEADGE